MDPEELTTRRRIKMDGVQEHLLMFPVLSKFSIKMLGLTSDKVVMSFLSSWLICCLL